MAKRARILLRVSSNQQLEADGDLTVQRQLVREYVEKQPDWILDEKEYFEGSSSGYKTAVAKRDVLQEALYDAEKGEYDILAAYKDDRIGRRMWEIGAYVMRLKSFGVEIYTVKDGCISPESDDIMGQMILALRYGNAQKSSSDTGMRVKDTAQKLVQKGKFMGGAAPYGYKLELSGEISKHGRALHGLVILPEKAEVVKYIYELSLNKEFGSVKIARILNEHEIYKKMAPRDIWKSGTITSILTNPIYAGYTAYKRRERINGRYRRLDSENWIISEKADESIRIIDSETWNRTQEKRRQRGEKYKKDTDEEAWKGIRKNTGELPLIDVIYCGYCKEKMTNGSKYNYWTIKATGEKRSCKIRIYKCQRAWQGALHDKTSQIRAERIEPLVLEPIAGYIGRLLKERDVWEQIEKNCVKKKEIKAGRVLKEKQELKKMQEKIAVMEKNIPDAMTGDYPLSLEELMELIRKYKEHAEKQEKAVIRQEIELKKADSVFMEQEKSLKKIPAWPEVFWNADAAVKRVLIHKLIERIEVKKTEIRILFKIDKEEYLSKRI